MEPVRINKLLAHHGVGSRRRAERLIEQGRVTIDGRPARMGERVDPGRASVAVDGVPLPVRPGLVYYLLNKPKGVVSTAADEAGRHSVVDLVPAEPRVYPVGRLDRDSAGLLILTNDGDLTLRLTHPRYGVEKVYSVLVEGLVSSGALGRLRAGVDLEDGPARAAAARIVDRSGDATLLEITMTEGRNREVRRLCEAVGHPVTHLFRNAIGPLTDPDLEAGEYRALTPAEVRTLYSATEPPR